MKSEFNNENVYVVFPSVIQGDNFVQEPINVLLAKKNIENNDIENSYIDILSGEKIYIYTGENLSTDKKYINVFRNDCMKLANYVFSIKSDYIYNLEVFIKLIKSIKTTYTKEELENILEILKEEIKNIELVKSKKIRKTKTRKRIRFKK